MMMMKGLEAAVLLTSLLLKAVAGFTTMTTRRRPHKLLKQQLLHAMMDPDSSSSKSSWKLKNEFPLFLNQLTVQTFLSVLGTLRDPHTVRYVDNFTRPIIPGEISDEMTKGTGREDGGNNHVNVPRGIPHSSRLFTYHGLGAINTTLFPTWESFFSTLLEQPTEEFLIQSAAGGLHVMDYELEINPASLCTRLMSIREQIALEFANDLGILANTMGQHTIDSYYDYMDDIGPKTSSSSTTTGSRRLPPHNLVFLGYALDPINGFTPSPLRQHNFDLATLLATQESIHRLLNTECEEKSNNDLYRQFLLDFYVERLDSHFVGTQPYGRADDFLEDLLFAPPRRVGGAALVVDPVRVAEWILQERREVALEWQSICKNIPNKDHIEIKRLQLNRLMQSYS